MAEGPLERFRQLVDAVHAGSLGTEGAGEGGEVRVGEIHLAVLPEDAFLEILDGAVALIVEDEEDDAELVLHRGGQLVDRKHEAAIAEHGEDLTIRLRDLGADRRGNSIAQGGGADRVKEGARLEHGEMPFHPVVQPRLVVDDYGGRLKGLSQDPDEPIRRLRVARPAYLAPRAYPRGVPLRGGLALVQRAHEALQPVSRVADDADDGLVHEPDHQRVEVDVDQRLLRLEVELEEEALGGSMGETAPDGQDHVGAFEGGLGRPVVGEHAQPKRIGLGNGAASHHRRDDGRAEPVSERRELPRRAGRDDAPTRHDEWALGRVQTPGRILDQLRITCGPSRVKRLATAFAFPYQEIRG